MQSHAVPPCAIVGSFDNINLAIGGPVTGIGEPQGRPCTATIWSMKDVKDEQTIVVCVVGLDANGIASSGGV
jgi:hypothetical protein